MSKCKQRVRSSQAEEVEVERQSKIESLQFVEKVSFNFRSVIGFTDGIACKLHLFIVSRYVSNRMLILFAERDFS